MIINMNKIPELAAQDKRVDGRALTEFRTPITIETDISWTAEGSSKVQIGGTVVMAGVKMSLEKPYNDTPDEGGIMINAELTPLSSSQYEPGPPGIKAIELARVIDRGIREAKAIDLKKLCITPGEKAWFVCIDLVSINDAGNLFDACSLAALAALKAAKLPTVDPETGVVDYKKKTEVSLPLDKEPVSVTILKVGDSLLVDPNAAEDSSYDARLTVASDDDGTISAMQKGGDSPLTVAQIEEMVKLALDKAKFLREELKKQVQ